ncbi:phosphatidylglycerol lysyltransferase domain-containing protein [Lysinibacillus sp. BW-2-10]|uniref:phosphatidylglycerol lysyltransferase domain-containing protein n=1 Tax=Lysinibacillus sp. BW-2-10 TaxID=2590030 RepID=UPI00117D895F|nr:phosphatidylglycerol lysyltransferase domain-containing protein [Lysinibacillus sp. BW-2-10]TSI10711.1 DUF2156 domain-containing protein [Lysinibacillus sp. BW-2-10]
MFFKNNLISLNKKQRVTEDVSSYNNCEMIEHFLKEKGGNHVSHLFFLQDKDFFWTENQKALIVYKRVFNTIFVLGDPIGEQTEIKNAINEFCQFNRENNLTPIFYQVSPEYMQYYHESGYRFLKVGEEGIVNLSQFSLEGKKGAKLRTRVNKFTKNDFTFRVVEPPYSHHFLSELKSISDAWLGNVKEKGFSVVSFSEDYVSRFPIALLCNAEGKIIAFATLATNYKHKITIDLMRKATDSPHGTMDVLFIHIFNWAKENGYEHCSLGMSPLSNVGNCKNAFLSEKAIRLVYLYGNSKYNFRGLKEFKDKFATSWEPKYIAYKKAFLPVMFLQLILLINKKQAIEKNSPDQTMIQKNEKIAL